MAATSAGALLALTCAACGGGSSDSEAGGAQPSKSSSPSGSPSDAESPFPTAEAQSAASAAVLTISDFPAGWSTSKDSSDDSESSGFQDQLAECLGAPDGLMNKDGAAAHEESPDFDAADGNTSVSETLSIDRTERAEQIFTILHQPNLTDCMSDAMGDYMKKVLADSDDADLQSAKLGDVEVGQLSAGHYGDDTVALRATLPFEVSGLSTSVYFDVLYVRHANAVESMIFQGLGTPVDPVTTARFTRIATRKLMQQDLPTG